MKFRKPRTNIILKEYLSVHSKLNPKLFNEEKQLHPVVKERLIEIANDFIDGLKENGIPLIIKDIWLVGSNAAYNYSSNSDIDLHILVKTEDIDFNEPLLKLLYDYAKSSYNKDYDIKIRGHKVELYLEDFNSTIISKGIYSILKDKWINKPTPEEDKDIYIEETEEYKEWQDKFFKLQISTDKEEIENFIDDLYILRKESLSTEGEYGTGNLIFKEFRNLGRLKELKDILKELKSKELTLESFKRYRK